MVIVGSGSRIEAFLFDMDGLIFDTERLYISAMTKVARDMELTLEFETALKTIGVPGSYCAHIWHEAFGVAFDAESFHRNYMLEYESLTRNSLPLKPGVFELLDVLDELHMPRAIVTSTERHLVEDHLQHAGLAGKFNVLVCEGEYADPKPHPSPYTTAASVLGVAPSNCLALEDSRSGMTSAIAAGTIAVMVPDLLPPTAVIRKKAFAILTSLHEVAELLPRSAKSARDTRVAAHLI